MQQVGSYNLPPPQQQLTQQELDLIKHRQVEEFKQKPRVKLDLFNAFGMNAGTSTYDISNGIHFLEEPDQSRLILAYPVGRHIGVRELRNNDMKFIRMSDNLKEVTAMAISQNKRYLAVCEIQKDDKNAYISFFDVKNPFFKQAKSPINVCEQQSPANQRYITQIAFSNDGKQIACLLNSPDCKALVIDWFSRSRILYTYDFHKVDVCKITFQPKDQLRFCTSGVNVFQLWGVSDNTLKQLNEINNLPKTPKADQELIFSDHVWTQEDYIIGCTKGGDLFVVEGFNVIQTLPYDKKNVYSCLHANSLGFCAATETGLLSFYKLNTDIKKYEIIFLWDKCKFLQGQKIISLSSHETSKEETYLGIATKNQNILYLEVNRQIYKRTPEDDFDYSSIGASTGFNDYVEDEKKEQEDKIQFEFVAKGFHNGKITCMDISIQRPILVTCSKEDYTIRIWNYYTGQQELSRVFYSLDKETQIIVKDKKTLFSCAMHPSGYYMAAGFQDKIRVMHVLHDELRDFKTLDHKACRQMKFSNGGHYFVCADQKQIFIYMSYTLEQIQKYPILPNAKISRISFNDKDTQLVFVQKEGYVQRVDLVSFKKGEGQIDKSCDFRSCAYINIENTQQDLNRLGQQTSGFGNNQSNLAEGLGNQLMNKLKEMKEECKVVVVGSENQRGVIRVYNEKENLELSFQSQDVRKFSDVCLIKSFTNGIENLIMGTTSGQIKVFGLPPLLQGDFVFDTFNAHAGAVSKILASPDGRFVFSAGADGSIFIYSVTEYANETTILKQDVPSLIKQSEDAHAQQASHNMQLVIDEELAKIVLVKKSMMESWRKKQEELKQLIEEENLRVGQNMTEDRFKHDKQIQLMDKTKQDQLNDLNKRYEDLQQQEAMQKDENTQTMKKMELFHLQCMEELQTLYEKKLAIENQNYSKLEKDKGEQRSQKEQEIKFLQRQNEEAIERLLSEFKNNLQKVQDEYEDSKRTADGLKMMYEEKLTQQEDEHEAEISELKDKYKKEREALEDVIGTLKNDIETIRRQIRRIKEEKKNFNDYKDKYSKKKKHYKDLLDKRLQTIEGLVQEKKEVQDKLKKKETELYKYKFKIKDLQKTKSVLTHRTQEMKSSLEPKEQQINNLKEQLLDLEKVFEKQSKSMQSLKEDVERREQKIKELDDQVNNEKNNTKLKEKTIQSFVNEIHKIVQMKDEKSYVQGLMRIYDQYVKKYSDEILEKKKKDPETIEELDRQLKYMEKSIGTLKVNTMKNEQRTKSNIKNKTQENTQLINDLNKLRKKKKDLEADLEDLNLRFQKLKLEIQRKRSERPLHNTTQGATSQMRGDMSEMGKGAMSQGQQYYTRPKSGSMMGGMNQEELPGLSQNASRASGSGILNNKLKGRLFKGSPFTFLKGNVEDKSKLTELTAQLEDNNQQILLQKLEIRSLKDQIIKLLEERGGIQELGEEGGSRMGTGSMQDKHQMGATMNSNLGGARGQSSSGMRVQNKMNKDKESFLPKVDSKSNM